MAEEIREFAVTIPAGTAIATPFTASIAFPERVVIAVTWRVPPGPSGKMGWALTSSGAPVIPIQRGTYIVTDNQAVTWNLSGYLDSGNWQVTGYNLGVYPHTVYLTFLLDLIGAVEPPPTASGGAGLGVIGASGTVIPPASPAPPASGSSSPPDDLTLAVIAAVLTAAASS